MSDIPVLYYCLPCEGIFESKSINWEWIDGQRDNPTCPICNGPVEGEPDPPYDHTGHDTLEEKYL